MIFSILYGFGASGNHDNRGSSLLQMKRQRSTCLARHQGIEDDASDRIAGIKEIAHCGTAGRGANVKVLFLKGVDNHISNVTIIIADENVLRLAHHSDHPRLAPPSG